MGVVYFNQKGGEGMDVIMEKLGQIGLILALIAFYGVFMILPLRKAKRTKKGRKMANKAQKRAPKEQIPHTKAGQQLIVDRLTAGRTLKYPVEVWGWGSVQQKIGPNKWKKVLHYKGGRLW